MMISYWKLEILPIVCTRRYPTPTYLLIGTVTFGTVYCILFNLCPHTMLFYKQSLFCMWFIPLLFCHKSIYVLNVVFLVSCAQSTLQ